MTNKYCNIFALGNKIVSYRQKKNGVYEARYHRNGIDVEVSSKDLNVLKQKFIAALNNLAATGSVRDRSCYTVRFNDFASSWLALKEKTNSSLGLPEIRRQNFPSFLFGDRLILLSSHVAFVSPSFLSPSFVSTPSLYRPNLQLSCTLKKFLPVF